LRILACLRRGLNVVQADLNRGLPMFGQGQFDVVLLSQTLQSVEQTEAIVHEILRVGKRAIVSFPNFAYRGVRDELVKRGRAPRTRTGHLSHPWYASPNRRYLSLLDWEDFCSERGIRQRESICLNTETGVEVTSDPNYHADVVIAVITRDS
jgi:homoserine O-acetyltransferase